MFSFLQKRFHAWTVTPNYVSFDSNARQLREEGEQYRFAFESNPLPLLIVDRTTLAVLDANRAALHHYGYSHQEFLCMSLRDLMAPGRGSGSVNSEGGWSDIYLEIPKAMGTLRHCRKNGALLDVELSTNPMIFNDREALIVAIQDVTETRRDMDLLREKEEEYRAIFEATGDALLVLDDSGSLIEGNAEACSMHGYSYEELLGLPAWALVHPSDRSQFQDFLGQLKAGDRVYAQETHIRKNGTPFSVEIKGTAFEMDGQSRILAVVRDITERKNLEAQLRHSQKLEAIGHLAQGIAHDFNNLLTAITGYSQLLLGRLEHNSSLRQDIEEIKKIGVQGVSLTKQLLAFSRKQALQPSILDFNAVVSNMSSMIGRLVGDHIALLTVLDPDLRPVKADQGQLEQVLLNLAVNARDAMPQGGTLSIKTENLDVTDPMVPYHFNIRPGNYVLLTVSDTGCGMDPQTQARIFEPFFTTKEQGKGTGLGLSTVYGIVQQSGGSIFVDSAIGHGTSFKVYLPRVDEKPRAGHHQVIRRAPSPDSATVLIVDDAQAVRSVARAILESKGYSVLEASHGSAALLVGNLHERPISLLLTDVVMRGMSGPQLTRALHPAYPDMKVLYMSGYPPESLLQQGLLTSEAATISKPFTPELLLQRVIDVLSSGT